MKIKLTNITLNYETKGQGLIPLIFLHGNGEDMNTFMGIETYLEDVCTMYFLDSRGHGQSDDVEVLHYSDIAEDVREFIEVLELNKPLIFGYSDGGNVALILASNYPTLVGDIMTAGANATPDGLGTALRAMQEEYRYMPNKYLKLMLDEPNLSAEDLARIQSNAYIVRGEHDVITREHTQWIASSISGSEYLEISNHDHGSYVSDPKILSEILKKYLLKKR